MRGGDLVMARADSVDVVETSGYERPSRLTQFTQVHLSGPRVNCGARGVGRTDRDDVKSGDLPLNISRGTGRETKILRVVENLVEKCLAKFAGVARKKDDFHARPNHHMLIFLSDDYELHYSYSCGLFSW